MSDPSGDRQVGRRSDGRSRKKDVQAEARSRGYIIRARRALLAHLLSIGQATADDIADAIGPAPDDADRRNLGAVPGPLARAGIIRRAGYAPSTRPSRHASALSVWELADREAALAWLADHPAPPDLASIEIEAPVKPDPSSLDRPLPIPHILPTNANAHRDGTPDGQRNTTCGASPQMGDSRKKLSDILMNSERSRLEQLWTTTTAAADLKPIPRGLYRCRVINGELFNARSGTPGYKLTLEVLDGDHAGRRFWHDIWLSPAALSMAKRDLSRLGIEGPEQLEQPLPDGFIVEAQVSLQTSDNGSEYNKVTRFEVVEVETPKPDPYAPTDEIVNEKSEGESEEADDSTDSDGFNWGDGQQEQEGEATP